MQSVSSRIWTRVAVSISYDDNDYTTGTSNNGWYAIKLNKTKPILKGITLKTRFKQEIATNEFNFCCSQFDMTGSTQANGQIFTWSDILTAAAQKNNYISHHCHSDFHK